MISSRVAGLGMAVVALDRLPDTFLLLKTGMTYLGP